MRRAEGGGDAVEVTLAEVGGDERADGGRAERPGGRPPARRSRWWYAAALAVVALGVVVATALDDRRDRERRAELARIPWVMGPMDRPPVELWRGQVGAVVVASGGVAVFVVDGEDPAVQGIALDTGERVWSRDLHPDEWCVDVRRAREPDDPPDAYGDGAARVACTNPSRDVSQGSAADGGTSSVVVVDVATGATAVEVEVRGEVVAVGEHDRDLLIASTVGDEVVVQRYEPDARRWAWTGPAAEGFLEAFLVGRDVVLRVEDGLLWWGGPGATALDLRTGEPVPDAPPAGSGRLLPDGGALVPERSAVGSRVLVTHALEADWTSRFEVEAEPWLPWVTDGSVDDVLTMRRVSSGPQQGGHRIIGVDARTGELRWEGELLVNVFPRVQVDGVLVGAGAGRTVALDVATGDVLWERGARMPPYVATMSDGDVLLVPDLDADLGHVLVAYEIRSGDVRWRLAIPEGSDYAGPVGDSIGVTHPDGTTVVFGWAD